MPLLDNKKGISKDDAFKLLERHARGEGLPPADEAAMLSAIWLALSRDRLVRSWANVPDAENPLASLLHPLSARSIADVLQAFMEEIKSRRWPELGEGDGCVQEVTSSVLANTFRFRLMQGYDDALNDAGLPRARARARALDGQHAINLANLNGPVEIRRRTVDAEGNENWETQAVEGPPSTMNANVGGAQPTGNSFGNYNVSIDPDVLGEHDENLEGVVYRDDWEGSLSETQFEMRCYFAAKKLVPSLTDRFRLIIETFAMPYYDPNAPEDHKDLVSNIPDQKVIAEKWSIHPSTLSRAIAGLGLYIPNMKADGNIVVPVSLTTPIGKYLVQGCGLSEFNLERYLSAMRQLCVCNSEHLQALKS